MITREIPDNFNELIKVPDKYSYFEVKEVTSGVTDVVKAAEEGFTSHESVYDVGILYDKIMGMLVLPFYGTFKQILGLIDYKSIDGYKECILDYFNSHKIPPTPILKYITRTRTIFLK